MFLANYDTLREISQSNPDEIKLSPFAMALIPEMSSSGNAENILAAVDPVR
jgi:hypothetical protein